MRFHFLHWGPIGPRADVDPSSRSRPDYLIRAGLGENTQVGIGVFGRWRPRWHRALERRSMPNFVRALESGTGHTATRQLGL
jgi:hypothetical protein